MQKILFKITFLCCFLWSLCSFAQDSTSAKYILPKKAIQYDWISYQLKIDLALPDRQEALNAFFVNRKDSIIYLNINKSGYELARVVLTPKTVIYVNRPNTEYYKGNYAFLSQKLGFPLTFNMIQALMTGETCPNYTIFSEYEKKDGLEYYLDNYRIFPPQKSYYSEDIEYNPTSKHIISHSLTDLALMRSLDIEYQNYVKGELFSFFSNLEVELDEDFTLKAELKNLKWNVPGPTSVRIPDKYTPIK